VFGSLVVVLTDAVLLIEVNRGVVGSTWTTTVKDPEAPAASEPIVQLTVPVAPTGGVEQLHPAGAARETNAVFAGSGSVSVAFCAGADPWFVAVIV
jgi:hypothetical protein